MPSAPACLPEPRGREELIRAGKHPRVAPPHAQPLKCLFPASQGLFFLSLKAFQGILGIRGGVSMERVREGVHGDGVGTALAPTYQGMLRAAAPGLGSGESTSNGR